MLSISVNDINEYILKPLGLHLCKVCHFKEHGWNSWTIVDNSSHREVKQLINRKTYALRFSTENSARRALMSQIDRFIVLKHEKLVQIMNPLYKAKNLEEAMIHLDMMVRDEE